MKQHEGRRDASSIDWVPHAILGLPVTALEQNCGLRFTEDLDDLDFFQGTETLLADGHEYVLRRYRGEPANQVTIHLPFEIDDRKEIAAAVTAVLTQLHLPREVIAWERVPPSEA